jgi:hypothetical protein
MNAMEIIIAPTDRTRSQLPLTVFAGTKTLAPWRQRAYQINIP